MSTPLDLRGRRWRHRHLTERRPRCRRHPGEAGARRDRAHGGPPARGDAAAPRPGRAGWGWQRGRERRRDAVVGLGAAIPPPPPGCAVSLGESRREGTERAGASPESGAQRGSPRPAYLLLTCGDGCYDDDDDWGGGGGRRGRRERGKGGLLQRGTRASGGGDGGGGEKRGGRKSPSHLRKGDPFWRERAEDREAAEAGRGCRFAGLLSRQEARPEPRGRCHRQPRRRRDPGPRAGENAAAAQAVTSSLSPLGRRRQQPEPDSLTSRRERHTEREMIISCVESSGKDPKDTPPPRWLSRRSPLRSTDCTAAPEGQTIFGLGKRSSREASLQIPSGCTRRGKSCQPSVCPGQAEVRSPHPPGGRRACGRRLKSRDLGDLGGGGAGGGLCSRKGPRSETCPCPESPRADPGEPHTQTPPSKFRRSPRMVRRRSEPTRERKTAGQ
ncbi:uncharacterized protein AAES06_013251 [Glossophaga mutica]